MRKMRPFRGNRLPAGSRKETAKALEAPTADSLVAGALSVNSFDPLFQP